jgi:hypothetical protein
LATQPFEQAHTAVNIGTAIDLLLHEFQIENHKIHLILRDAQSSMILGIENLGFSHMDCFIHKIMLV